MPSESNNVSKPEKFCAPQIRILTTGGEDGKEME